MFSRTGIMWLSVVAYGVMAPGVLLAHHGSAIYDETKTVMVKGIVTD